MLGISHTPSNEISCSGSPFRPPTGCTLRPPFANERCKVERPLPLPVEGGTVAWHAIEEGRLPVEERLPPADRRFPPAPKAFRPAGLGQCARVRSDGNRARFHLLGRE